MEAGCYIVLYNIVFYLIRTSDRTRLVPGLARPCAAQAAAGFRCWDLKLEMGTVLEPRVAGVADARGRRAASPRVSEIQ